MPVIRDVLRHTRLAATEGYAGEADMAERFDAVEKMEVELRKYLA